MRLKCYLDLSSGAPRFGFFLIAFGINVFFSFSIVFPSKRRKREREKEKEKEKEKERERERERERIRRNQRGDILESD